MILESHVHTSREQSYDRMPSRQALLVSQAGFWLCLLACLLGRSLAGLLARWLAGLLALLACWLCLLAGLAVNDAGYAAIFLTDTCYVFLPWGIKGCTRFSIIGMLLRVVSNQYHCYHSMAFKQYYCFMFWDNIWSHLYSKILRDCPASKWQDKYWSDKSNVPTGKCIKRT